MTTEMPMTDASPWLQWYKQIPANLTYPDATLYEVVDATAKRVPEDIAWDFFDTTATYRQFLKYIDTFADALAALGLKNGERILIALPTSPQGVIAFYAANKLGAVSVFVHPLSTTKEMEHYLNASGARIILTLDAFYDRFATIKPRVPLETLILARIGDYLSPLKKIGFWLDKGRKISHVPVDDRVRWWSVLMQGANPSCPRAHMTVHDPAVILFSGGTTGMPKGIVLSNYSLIAEGMQVGAWADLNSEHSVLAILPLFHGFGLGVCVNAVFMIGAKSILVPTFTAKLVARLIRQKKPNCLVGVPTLFAALIKDPLMSRTDLSCLRFTFSGGDVLPRSVKDGFEQLMAERGGSAKLLTGYGLTEAVTAVMAMPLEEYRQESIGIPFPDMLAKICTFNTDQELPPGADGEICLCGPDVMLGYLDDPVATEKTLRTHSDGRIWLHTGDIGKMDADGFFYFIERQKRLIKSSGFNVFPGQVEAVLCQHPLVLQACVVGVPDPMQGERVKAYVVLKEPVLASTDTERTLIEHCHLQLIKWSCPREIEFRGQLPTTRIGKIDYKQLVQEHISQHENRGSA